MNRKFSFSVGEYYHLYNRGVEKRDIFLDHNDWLRFQTLLYTSNSTGKIHLSDFIPSQGRTLTDVYSENVSNKDLVDIGAYCLMPNHFHILIREKVDGGVSAFMKKLLTGYSMYFNTKYQRIGPLFQGKFKAKHANTDEYLKYLFAYIHLNPIKIIEPGWKETGISDKLGADKYLEDYSFSSLVDYLGSNRPASKIIDRDSFPEYFEQPKNFESYVNWWLKYKEE